MEDLIELSKEQRAKALEAIKVFFAHERDEDLGDLAAMLVLDFIEKTFGPFFYNKGIEDAKYFLQEKIEDLYSLEK